MIIDRSAELDQLATALSAAQAVMQGAVKDRANPAFRSTYADLSSVWDACRAALTSNGLAVSQHTGTDDHGRCVVDTVLLHKSGQFLSSRAALMPKDPSPAVAGSCYTYLRRYALAAAVGVAPEDDDGHAANGPQAQRAPASQPQPQPSQEFMRTVERVAQTFGGTVESIERIPAPSGIDPMCPTCGTSMWDNRPKKAAGEMNPKAPDFKCKDKSCQGVIWKYGEKPRAPRATAPQVAPSSDDDGPGFPF
jgi:hypothetical protein